MFSPTHNWVISAEQTPEI